MLCRSHVRASELMPCFSLPADLSTTWTTTATRSSSMTGAVTFPERCFPPALRATGTTCLWKKERTREKKKGETDRETGKEKEDERRRVRGEMSKASPSSSPLSWLSLCLICLTFPPWNVLLKLLYEIYWMVSCVASEKCFSCLFRFIRTIGETLHWSWWRLAGLLSLAPSFPSLRFSGTQGWADGHVSHLSTPLSPTCPTSGRSSALFTHLSLSSFTVPSYLVFLLLCVFLSLSPSHVPCFSFHLLFSPSLSLALLSQTCVSQTGLIWLLRSSQILKTPEWGHKPLFIPKPLGPSCNIWVISEVR